MPKGSIDAREAVIAYIQDLINVCRTSNAEKLFLAAAVHFAEQAAFNAKCEFELSQAKARIKRLEQEKAEEWTLRLHAENRLRELEA